MAFLGLIVSADALRDLTHGFLALKRTHFRGRFPDHPTLHDIAKEIKGTEIQKMTRDDSRDKRRHAQRFRMGLLDLIEDHGCRIVGRVWVKKPGQGLDDRTYSLSVCKIAANFGHYLRDNDAKGLVIADHRTAGENMPVAHALFTEKWRTGGSDGHPLLREVPLFGDGRNHAALQIADLVGSSLLFPMAVAAYCKLPSGLPHSSSRYEEVRQEFGQRLKGLEYRYREHGRPCGGFVICDPVGQKSRSALFDT
jgi:hypothetical protein